MPRSALSANLLVPKVGHYGIFSGRRWRELVYPKMQKFIAANDQPQSRAGARESLAAEDQVKPGRKPAATTATAPVKKAAAAKKAAPAAKRATAPKKAPARKTAAAAR